MSTEESKKIYTGEEHVHSEHCECGKNGDSLDLSQRERKNLYEMLKKEFEPLKTEGEQVEVIPEQKKGAFEVGKVYILEGKKFALKKRKDREIILRLQ
jgi:hypothetical protein